MTRLLGWRSRRSLKGIPPWIQRKIAMKTAVSGSIETEVAFTGSLKYRRVRYYYHKVVRCLVWKPTMPEQTKGGLR